MSVSSPFFIRVDRLHGMLQTEYKGSKYMALLEEFRSIGISGAIFRSGYELSKKLGVLERRHTPGILTIEDVIRALDLEMSGLADVRSAYDNHKIDRAALELIKHLRSRRTPEFFFDWRERKLYQGNLKGRFADQEEQLVRQADEICSHEFRIFGSNCVRFGSHVNWHLEPGSGRTWPLIHWSKIDVRGQDRIGDVRLTWEINRHQFFFILGRAYWFTGDEKYARKFADLMRGWIHANPPEMGINWYSNLEIAVRLIAWLWAYHFFLDSPFFDDDLHLNFLKTILQSCRHITKDIQYSLRSMGNNHVIGDAAALAFAGIAFPEFKELQFWRDTYINVLYRELDKQVYEDGADFEQSISYHRFVLYFYLLLLRIMQINNYNVPVGVLRKVEKMAEFMMHVMKPDGTMPGIGDSDDANVVCLSNDEPDVLTPVLSTGAVLFQRGDFRKAAGRMSEETFWLTGKESIHSFGSLEESSPSSQSRGFRDGGYYVMRTGWDADSRYMLFKCGPHADHGHADALHIELHCDGKGCLRDCGTYTYNGPWEWRTFFRSTKAHNTVVVDRESQSIPHRAFRWLKPAKSEAIAWITTRGFDYVDAKHDGYSRYEKPVIHRRSVMFIKPEYWIVIDQLTGCGEHSIELLFNTPYDKYELEESTKIFRSKELAIIPVMPEEIKPEIYECAGKPIQGWFSPCYGTKQSAATLVYSCAGELPITMITVLDPGRSILDAQCIEHRGVMDMTINIESSDFSDTLVFNREQAVSDSLDVDTDAELIFIRKGKTSGSIVRLSLISGSYVSLGGRMLLKASEPVKSVNVSALPEGEAEIEVDPEVNLGLQL